MLVMLMVLAAATAGSNASQEQFVREFNSGADCPRLFELRNAAKQSATEAALKEMNAKLQSVECYSSSSKRKSNAPAARPTFSFLVREYRIYRDTMTALAAAPDAPDGPVLKKVAKKYGVTVAVVEKTIEKVQTALSKNHWFGQPEAEIAHASDWKGEKP
jgi:hypothetical protein